MAGVDIYQRQMPCKVHTGPQTSHVKFGDCSHYSDEVALNNNNITDKDGNVAARRGGMSPRDDSRTKPSHAEPPGEQCGVSVTDSSRLEKSLRFSNRSCHGDEINLPFRDINSNGKIWNAAVSADVGPGASLADKKISVQGMFTDINSLSCDTNHHKTKHSTADKNHHGNNHSNHLSCENISPEPPKLDMILCPKKLLDKLLVVCPNVDYCEEVLPRCDLEAHLTTRCKGAITKCLKADLGCVFQGPRSALQSHLWECPYRDAQTGVSTLSHIPVQEGEVSTIDIQRGCYDLGLSFVGGIDTPLLCVVIQEIFPDGVVAKDARLQPGDQVLEVNGVDLTTATHSEAKAALEQVYPICRLTVYREKSDDNQPPEKEEILRVSLPKLKGRQLGIKLVGKKNGPGLYILDMVPGGTAYHDGRLNKDDRILEINCQDMGHGTQEQAAQVIQASVDKVQFVVSRKTRPQTPDIIRSTSRECLYTLPNRDIVMGYASLKPCKERSFSVQKDAHESLGISVAGGYGNPRGDIPIYVTNIQAEGCIGRSKQVKKGDILLTINGHSLLDLTHSEAVKVLKSAAEAKSVSLKMLEGSESSCGVGNFTPSWKFWLSLPPPCFYVRTVVLDRPPTGTLGFSIVGGNDSGQGPVPIYMKSIVPNTPAGRDGRLRSGDMLQSVNGQNLEDVPHGHAVSLLKSSKGFVSLRVISWPGTAV